MVHLNRNDWYQGWRMNGGKGTPMLHTEKRNDERRKMEHTDGSDGSDSSLRPIRRKLDARPKESVGGEK